MTDGTRKSPGERESSNLRAALGRFAVPFVVLLVVLPVVVELVVPTDVPYAVWLESTKGVRLQQRYGFVLEVRGIAVAGTGRLQLPVISEVVPNGPFARLGVQAGDVVMCLPNGVLAGVGLLFLFRLGLARWSTDAAPPVVLWHMVTGQVHPIFLGAALMGALQCGLAISGLVAFLLITSNERRLGWFVLGLLGSCSHLGTWLLVATATPGGP